MHERRRSRARLLLPTGDETRELERAKESAPVGMSWLEIPAVDLEFEIDEIHQDKLSI